VVIFGGADVAPDDLVQAFDPMSGTTTVIGHMPDARADLVAAVIGGQVLVFGGWTPTGASSAILRFNPATRAITEAGTLPEAVADEAIAPIGDSVYFASGLGTGQQPLVQIGSLTVTPST
jgi:Kelch motif